MSRSDVLSLEQVFEEPVSFEFDLSFSAPALGREPLVEISPVHFEGNVSRIEGGHALEGRLSYEGRLECSRCLVLYPFEEREQFSLLLYKRSPQGSEERELERSDLDAYFYEEPEVAVVPIVEERIQLAVPMKPLCSADCRGLCVQCGADLNQAPCGCASQASDPRWEALKILQGGPEDRKAPR
jgi:DUF177 domain-containing protein